jgi:hypothetical protein
LGDWIICPKVKKARFAKTSITAKCEENVAEIWFVSGCPASSVPGRI